MKGDERGVMAGYEQGLQTWRDSSEPDDCVQVSAWPYHKEVCIDVFDTMGCGSACVFLTKADALSMARALLEMAEAL